MLHNLTYFFAALSGVTSVQVKPILARLKTTLAGSTAALVLSAGLLVGLVQAGTDADGIYGNPLVQCLATQRKLYLPTIIPPVDLAVLGFLSGVSAVRSRLLLF